MGLTRTGKSELIFPEPEILLIAMEGDAHAAGASLLAPKSVKTPPGIFLMSVIRRGDHPSPL